MAALLAPETFRASDIRGTVGSQIDAGGAYALGRILAEHLERSGPIVVGRDGRPSGVGLTVALIDGLAGGGRQVLDVGVVPTSLAHYCMLRRSAAATVMVTGSHLPEPYNGFKLLHPGGAIGGERLRQLGEAIASAPSSRPQGPAAERLDLTDSYVEELCRGGGLGRRPRVVVMSDGSAAATLLTRVLTTLGCETVVIDEQTSVTATVRREGADLAVATDHDGDRLEVHDHRGAPVRGDHLSWAFARRLLDDEPGARIVIDGKSSTAVGEAIAAAGGEPVRCPTGHAFVRDALRRTGAAMAGEISGHYYFREPFGGHDDALWAAARLARQVSREPGWLARCVEDLADRPRWGEVRIELPEGLGATTCRALQRELDNAEPPDASGGVRLRYANGWALVRPSTTEPRLSILAEARDRAALDRIRAEVTAALARHDISIPEAEDAA